MDNSQMPLDKQKNPIPVLGLKTSTFQTLDGAVSTIFSETEIVVIRIAAVDDVWVKVGENPTGVTLEGAYFPAGSVEYIAVHPKEKVAVFGGVISIVETK